MAEECVADWYTDRGWQVLARRWRAAGGELDLVVHRDGCLRFVEVKLRAEGALTGWEVFTPTKMSRVRRVADAWLQTWKGPLTDCAISAALVTHSKRGWQIDVLDEI